MTDDRHQVVQESHARIERMLIQLAICINSLEGAVIALHDDATLSKKAEDHYLQRLAESQGGMRALLELMNGQQEP